MEKIIDDLLWVTGEEYDSEPPNTLREIYADNLVAYEDRLKAKLTKEAQYSKRYYHRNLNKVNMFNELRFELLRASAEYDSEALDEMIRVLDLVEKGKSIRGEIKLEEKEVLTPCQTTTSEKSKSHVSSTEILLKEHSISSI